MFKGFGFGEKRYYHFTSQNEFHKLDGIKINSIHLDAIIDGPDEVQELIDWLEITKLSIK